MVRPKMLFLLLNKPFHFAIFLCRILNMKIKPIITERLKLRQFRAQDLEAIHVYATDLDVVKYTDWGPNAGIAVTKAVLDARLKSQKMAKMERYEFAITLKKTGELIGSIGITPKKTLAVFGYVLNKNFWNRGYVTEAVQALLKFAQKRFGLKKFRATCHVSNIGSRRVLEKCGLRLVRTIKKHKKIRGKWRDTFVFEKNSS